MTTKKTLDKNASQATAKTAQDKTATQLLWAKMAYVPELQSAGVSTQYLDNIVDLKKTSWDSLTKALVETTELVSDGDLRPIERMLFSQATALQSIFTNLARRASKQDQLKHFEVFLNLGLKAQSQSRATLQALIELKLPRQAVFAKQANIAQGHQQVNNGVTAASRTEENQTLKNKLLADQPHGGTYLDISTTIATSQSHQGVAAVAVVNRAKNKQGQGKGC
jgi:hypothetical protein